MSDALETVVMRNEFYRDNFRRAVFILLISVLLNVILAIATLVLFEMRATPVYFASTADGRLVSIEGEAMPPIDNAAILAWVSRTVPQLYRLDYVNSRNQINDLRDYFTPLGWQQFAGQFTPMVQQVLQNKWIVSATLYDVPSIVASGRYAGVPSWQVQVPVLVSYQQGDKVQTSHIVMQLLIQRTTSTQTGQALAINQVLEKVIS